MEDDLTFLDIGKFLKKLRIAKCIKFLGGKCTRCGSKKNLEFDHIDPTKKEFAITQKIVLRNPEKLAIEVKKCQLLCIECHKIKTGNQSKFYWKQQRELVDSLQPGIKKKKLNKYDVDFLQV
jgi:5-methylcytosine-specific restriction endonuclease McrA